MLMNPGCRIVRAGGAEDVLTPCYDVPLERKNKVGGDTRAWLLGVRQLALWHEVCAERRRKAERDRKVAAAMAVLDAARRDRSDTLSWARANAERMARRDFRASVRLAVAKAQLEIAALEAKGAAE